MCYSFKKFQGHPNNFLEAKMISNFECLTLKKRGELLEKMGSANKIILKIQGVSHLFTMTLTSLRILCLNNKFKYKFVSMQRRI